MSTEIHPQSKSIDDAQKEKGGDDVLSDEPVAADAPGCKLFGRLLGIVITVCVNIAIFVVINFFWEYIPFLSDDFPDWLPYANISILASVIVQLLKFFLEKNPFMSLIEAGGTIFSLVSTVMLLVIFPFDFEGIKWSGSMDAIVRVLLYLTIAAITIGTIVNIVSFFSKLLKRGVEGKDE